MRWTMNTRKPKIGDTRYRSGFLFLPKLIYPEWRWFEFAKWQETLILKDALVPDAGPLSGNMKVRSWKATKWLYGLNPGKN